MAQAVQLSQQQASALHLALQAAVGAVHPHLQEVVVDAKLLRDQHSAAAHPHYPDPEAAYTVPAPAGVGAAVDDAEEEVEREDGHERVVVEVAADVQRMEEHTVLADPADAAAAEEAHTVPAAAEVAVPADAAAEVARTVPAEAAAAAATEPSPAEHTAQESEPSAAPAAEADSSTSTEASASAHPVP